MTFIIPDAALMQHLAILSFKAQPIADWCRNLKLIENYVRPLSKLKRDMNRTEEDALRQSGTVYTPEVPPAILSDMRLRYIETCGLLSSRLNGSGPFLILGDEPEPFP